MTLKTSLDEIGLARPAGARLLAEKGLRAKGRDVLSAALDGYPEPDCRAGLDAARLACDVRPASP
ncbi:MAG: hypothetical protein U1E62_06480 [Alsobacter sp.]